MSRSQPSDLYAHPRDIITEAVAEFGIDMTVDTCLALLDGHEDYALLPVPLAYLAGVHAVAKLERGDLASRQQGHWPRVWAARTFRYVWLDRAGPGTAAALSDPSWRVREMAAKVVSQRSVTIAADQLLSLLHDPEPRVRVAAVRALGVVGGAEHAVHLKALEPADSSMRVAVDGALPALRLSGMRAPAQ